MFDVAQPPKQAPKARIGTMAVVTCFYNPMRYKQPRYNYDVWAEGMATAGLPVYCVELVYDDDEPEIEGSIVVRGSRAVHLLWQKERLLNMAIRHVPHNVDAIMWSDCDLLWLGRDWVGDTLQALQHYHTVQPYAACYTLMPDGELCRHKRSAGWTVHHRRADVTHYGRSHPGYAWAWRAQALRKLGLYCGAVTGGGDTVMCRGLIGGPVGDIDPHISSTWARDIDTWAAAAGELGVRRSVGYINSTVLHLYHGTTKNRNYIQRWQALSKSPYDPLRHLQVSPVGLLEWTEAAYAEIPTVVNYVAHSFTVRNEDDLL